MFLYFFFQKPVRKIFPFFLEHPIIKLQEKRFELNFLLKNSCLAFCQCFRGGDKRDERKLNCEEHKTCYWVWRKNFLKKDIDLFFLGITWNFYNNCISNSQEVGRASKLKFWENCSADVQTAAGYFCMLANSFSAFFFSVFAFSL